MKLLPACFLFGAFAGTSALNASTFNYQFVVDTSSLNGQAGNLDFQLNPGGMNAPAVTVSIRNLLVGGGSFNPADIQLTNGAVGSLSSSLTLTNTGGYNDAFQPVTLGSSVDFLAVVSGAGIDTPGNPGTFFGFSIYDAAGVNAQLTSSPDGTISGFNADSLNGVVTFSNDPGATVTTVPEPSSAVLLLFSLGVLLFLRVRTGGNPNYGS